MLQCIFELSEIKFAKHEKPTLAAARTSLTQTQMSPNGRAPRRRESSVEEDSTRRIVD